MYKALLVLSVGLIIGGAFYYFHINYPDFFKQVSIQQKVDSGVDEDNVSVGASEKEGKIIPPSSLIAESLKGVYVSTDNSKLELTSTGNAKYISSDNTTTQGFWTIDDTGTITFRSNDASAKQRLFDVDESTKSIIEVSSVLRTVYTRQ